MRIIIRVSLAILFACTTMSTSWAQWVQANGPFGRHVHSFSVSSQGIYAITQDSIYFSTNHGISWTGSSTGLSITDYSFRSFAALGPHLFVNNNGCFHSTNNGVTWGSYIDSISGAPIVDFAGIDSNLFAGTYGAGVYVSRDTGTTWTAVNDGLTSLRIGKLYLSGKNLFALSDSGYFLSTNNGTSWFHLQTNGVGNITGSDSVLYGVVKVGSPSGLYRSTDTGNTWVLLDKVHYPVVIAACGALVLAATDPNLDGRIFCSTDYGASWADVSTGLTDRNIMAFAVTDSVILVGSWNGGMYRSTDHGSSWTEANNGISATCPLSVTSLALSGGDLFAGTWGGGIFRSSDNGSSWKEINEGLEIKHVISLAAQGTRIFAGTSIGGVFRSENEGESWTAVNNGLPIDGTPLQFLPLAFHDTTLFAAVNARWSRSGGIFRTMDNGSSWTAVNGPPYNALASVTCFAISGTSIYAGGGGLFHSTDKGLNWVVDTVGLPFGGEIVTCLAASDTNVFAGNVSYGIYRSSINGEDWKAAKIGFPSYPSVNCIAAGGNCVFADLMIGGIYISTDNGASWSTAAKSFPYGSIYTLLASDSIVYAGMYGGTAYGIYHQRISALITGIVHNEDQLPSHFALYQNYPNPFNPSTVIGYQLSASSYVSLKVYDVLGREVETLVNERQIAGDHSVRFDATNLPSGVYFYRLQAGSYHDIKKLLLLK